LQNALFGGVKKPEKKVLGKRFCRNISEINA